MSIWNPRFEQISREELEQLQLERLQSTLNRVYRNVVYYQKVFDREGIVPEEVADLSDLKKIPFTDRSTLRAAYPYDMFAVPLRDVVRLQTSAGTTGEPIVVGYTRNDIAHWTELTARLLSAAGVGSDDMIQIAFDYGLFPGALGMHFAAAAIGAAVIPVSAIGAEKQIRIMRDFRSTVLIAPPSYGRRVASALSEMKIAPSELNLRVGIFGAEPWSESLRHLLEEGLHLQAFDFYGLSEIFNPGVAGECEARNGLHIFEDHFIPEIIDPATARPLPAGEEGELVLTSVSKEAFPMVRYRTGDITALLPGRCSCGRTLIRMARVKGRTDDLIFVQGVNVFPSQIEQVLARIEGCEPHFQVRIGTGEEKESVELRVEISPRIFFDEMRRLQALQRTIADEISRGLGLTVTVKLTEPKSLQKDGVKAPRVIDNRRGNGPR
jgi:phenylacetate-CoA ligase